MKTKFLSLFIAVTALIINLSSCNAGGAGNTAYETADTITVDSFFASADSLTGDTVYIKGLCSHLCRHGGKKAFITGVDSTLVLRCEATTSAGGAFSPDCVGKQLIIKGVVCENRIDEATIADMERTHAENSSADHKCATEAKAQGQDSIDSFAASIADYRQRIAENNATNGKAYISFFYIEAVSYDIK